jgi:hypothetical protein
MIEHESYEILCALAASGRASDDDLKQLSDHMSQCADCREQLSDFVQLSAQVLPLHADTYKPRQVPSGMTKRFRERARAEGITLDGSPRSVLNHRLASSLAWSAAAAILVLVGVFAFRNVHGLRRRGADSETVARAMPNPAQKAPSDAAVTEGNRQFAKIAELQRQLSSSEQDIVRLKQLIVDLQHELGTAKSAQENASSHISSVESENAVLRAGESAKNSQLADLDRQLKEKQSATVEEIATLAEKESELEKLGNQLTERQRELDRERQLLAASAQARDLITARNLHIIDVHDNDRSGRQVPFGRIFYTEGQSLIFYAYDLDAAEGRNTKVAFHVWGGTLGDQKRVRNLGIFRSEDAAAGRWVLTFDDPRVLAQINTVFVTAESAKNTQDQPKGKRILYAFLGDRPNHP